MRTSGIAGVPARSACRASSAVSNPSAFAASPMAAAAASGITPDRASALARAASKSSIARSTLASENTWDSRSVAARLSINRVNMNRSYTSKKTVSRSPCSRISMRHVFDCPATGCAISVARRASGTMASTASSPFAASPAK